MSSSQREAARDMSEVTGHPFAPFYGARIEWREDYGAGAETRRAWIGRSTGWRPCLLTLHNTRSRGGDPAPDARYIIPNSVRLVRRGPQ